MQYKSGEAPKAGDKVLGDKIKGRVADVGSDKVVVVTRGPWNPKGPETEVRTPCDPADLILVSRAPEKPKK
jgi:hypothetical protein